MRIAALYDIHGNASALASVLAEFDALGVERVVVGGDVVAGPQPRETLDLLLGLALEVDWVMGNGDREALDPSGAPQGLSRDLATWVGGRLTERDRDLVRSFRPTVAIGDALFCHATPRSDESLLTRLSSVDRFVTALGGTREPTVVCGHVHQQYDVQVAGHRVVNAGSIGMPHEGDAAAFWAVLEGGEVTLMRTGYDVEGAVARMRGLNAPGFEELWRESLIAPVDRSEVVSFFEGEIARGMSPL